MANNWLRNRNTVEFLGIWERLHNPDFNSVEFDRIKTVAGLNNFRLSAKEWMARTSTVGIISRAGRYGGTYAHKDIAFEFAMWITQNVHPARFQFISLPECVICSLRVLFRLLS